MKTATKYANRIKNEDEFKCYTQGLDSNSFN